MQAFLARRRAWKVGPAPGAGGDMVMLRRLPKNQAQAQKCPQSDEVFEE